jgi:hypothetical protein
MDRKGIAPSIIVAVIVVVAVAAGTGIYVATRDTGRDIKSIFESDAHRQASLADFM